MARAVQLADAAEMLLHGNEPGRPR
jgi:hypothetical protein